MRQFLASRKHSLLLLLGVMLLFSASLVCVFTSYSNFQRLSQHTTGSITIRTASSSVTATPTPYASAGSQQEGHESLPHRAKTPSSIAHVVQPAYVPAFEAGIAYLWHLLLGLGRCRRVCPAQLARRLSSTSLV